MEARVFRKYKAMDAMMIILVAVGFLMLFTLTLVMASLYKKCGPNEALIISGFAATESSYPLESKSGAAANRGGKIITGGGAIVLPTLQQVNRVSLGCKTDCFEKRSLIIAPWTVWLESHSLLEWLLQDRCFSVRLPLA
jgi:hypothetical protein